MPNCSTTLMSCVMQGTVGDHIQTEAKGHQQICRVFWQAFKTLCQMLRYADVMCDAG